MRQLSLRKVVLLLYEQTLLTLLHELVQVQ